MARTAWTVNDRGQVAAMTTSIQAAFGAGIMACVMASDSQTLALSTMFTEDVFAFYGGAARFGGTYYQNGITPKGPLEDVAHTRYVGRVKSQSDDAHVATPA